MGEAIARFYDMAISVRWKCDERHSQPRGCEVSDEAAREFALRCREQFEQHRNAGTLDAEGVLYRLCQFRDAAEINAVLTTRPDYIEWIPDVIEPSDAEWKAGFQAARREATRWGSLFPVVEARLKELESAALMMTNYAAAEYYANPSPAPWNQADRDYSDEHVEFGVALDALAPFIEEPPTSFASNPSDACMAAASDAAEQPSPPRPRGRPKQNDELLEKELVDAWLALSKRQEGSGERKTSKPQFIEERNRDALKDPVRLAARNAEHFKLLENGLRNRRRKLGQSRTKRR
jgi:hypothetical protein